MQIIHPLPTLIGAVMLAALVGCSGSGSQKDVTSPETPSTSEFTKSAAWTFDTPDTGESLCFDFDSDLEVNCIGNQWDLKATGDGSTVSLRSNGGVSGGGDGGVLLGLQDWENTPDALKNWTTALVAPDDTNVAGLYSADSSAGIFTQQLWYAYDLEGTHLLYPNNRVYLITTDSSDATIDSTTAAPVYALQIIGYYGGAAGTASGYPKVRWIDRQHPDDVRTQIIDASDDDNWVYFDLQSGAVVDSPDADNWQIAFKRADVKLNGGDSGDGKVAGFLGRTPSGFYDADGEPIKAKFLQDNTATTLADLKADDSELASPAAFGDWLIDQDNSLLNPPSEPNGQWGDPDFFIDFGWYIYHPMAGSSADEPAHRIVANPDQGILLRSGEGNSYARVHLVSITYTDSTDATSQTSWAFEFDVQPTN